MRAVSLFHRCRCAHALVYRASASSNTFSSSITSVLPHEPRRCYAVPPRAAAAAAASGASAAAAAADGSSVAPGGQDSDDSEHSSKTLNKPGQRRAASRASARGGGPRGGARASSSSGGRRVLREPSPPPPPLPAVAEAEVWADDVAAPNKERQQPPGAALPGWFATGGDNNGSSADSTSTSTSSSSTSSSSSGSDGAVARELAALSPQQRRQLETYLDYMLEVNQSMNLTAVRERGEAWARHIEDSLALLPAIEAACFNATSSSISSSSSSTSSSSSGGSGKKGKNSSFTVIDVGSGAGLPGMVLAIARPAWRVTLLDSLRKRCAFLEAAAARAGATNVSVVWARAEEGARRADLREKFDLAVARAVAAAPVICELTLPFVRPGGALVAAKGAAPEAEAASAARAVELLAGRGARLEVVPVDSIAPEGRRTALVVAKRAPTPHTYPRSPGTPARKPL